jgi:hypothetical protein
MSPTVSFGGSILAFGAIVGDKKEFQEVDCVSMIIQAGAFNPVIDC